MRIDHIATPIEYSAPQHVRDIVAGIGRTEDVRFSPSNRRLALAGFIKNKIAVLDVSISACQESTTVALTGAAAISSAYLKGPHGLDFIDDERLLVANRDGRACIFELPPGLAGSHELAPLAIIGDDIRTPGSVAVVRREQGVCEALICNNYAHRVTRHLLDAGAGYSIKGREVLLKKWLHIPDGICVSNEGQWIAVSNHTTRTVLLYENNPSLNASSDPHGVLRRAKYPHGLRFTSDDRYIVVAGGGSPCLNIYAKGDSTWHGVRDPLLSVRVLTKEAYLRGRHNPMEGGPKGVDIHSPTNTLVTTCESQPLAFFDLATILGAAPVSGMHSAGEARTEDSGYVRFEDRLHNRKPLKVSYELHRGQIAAAIEWCFDRARASVRTLLSLTS